MASSKGLPRNLSSQRIEFLDGSLEVVAFNSNSLSCFFNVCVRVNRPRFRISRITICAPTVFSFRDPDPMLQPYSQDCVGESSRSYVRSCDTFIREQRR